MTDWLGYFLGGLPVVAALGFGYARGRYDEWRWQHRDRGYDDLTWADYRRRTDK